MPIPIQTVRAALRGSYTVEREIGRGGVATVYLGRRDADARDVAIKVLRPEFAVTLIGDRFQREVHFLSRLDHPNILELLDSAEVDHLVYYVMPYATGGSLRDRLDEHGRFSFDAALGILRQIASGVDYLHANNVLHRDLKPENIMFEGDRVVLGDFGVARALVRAGGERISTAGLVLGTPTYMSPEQAGGHAELDHRADIYGLACVAHEMLAGDPPFTGRSVQAVMTAQLREQPPPIRRVRPDLPEAFERALLRALDKNPDRRPSSAGGFVEALGSAAP
jgi:serine/threonine-protein kinase